MKVIKRIRRQTTEQKLHKFYLEIGIISKIVLVLYSFASLVALSTTDGLDYTFAALFYMRLTEIIFFILVGVSDIKREEEKGSFYLILTFLLKNILLWIVHKTLAALIDNWPYFSNLAVTAIAIQYLFMIAVEDAFAKPESLKYLFIEPFQLKTKFYPFFIFIILMAVSIRVDLIVPFFLGIILHFCKVNAALEWVSKKLNDKFMSERMIQSGFIKGGAAQRKTKQLDELATNDSIFLEEK